MRLGSIMFCMRRLEDLSRFGGVLLDSVMSLGIESVRILDDSMFCVCTIFIAL